MTDVRYTNQTETTSSDVNCADSVFDGLLSRCPICGQPYVGGNVCRECLATSVAELVRSGLVAAEQLSELVTRQLAPLIQMFSDWQESAKSDKIKEVQNER